METLTKPDPAVETLHLPVEKVGQHAGTLALSTSEIIPVSELAHTMPTEHTPKPAEVKVASFLAEQQVDRPDLIPGVTGLTAEETQAVKDTAEIMRPHTRIAINMPRYGLEGLLRDGKYKSMHETGHGATVSQDERKYKESKMGLLPADGEDYVVYGYLTDTTEPERAPMKGVMSTYGTVSVVLRPEVSARSTFTEDDSITPTGSSSMGTPRFMGFEEAALAEQARQIHVQKGERTPPYTEAQIRGGVTLEDIESISIDVFSEGEANQRGSLDGVGEKAFGGLDSVPAIIKEMREKAPDIPLTIRIGDPGPGNITKELIDMIGENPDVEFVMVLDAASPFVQQNETQSPQDSDIEEGVEIIQQEQLEKTKDSHEERSGRRDATLEAVAKYWKEKHGKDADLPNFKVVLTGHSRRVRR